MCDFTIYVKSGTGQSYSHERKEWAVAPCVGGYGQFLLSFHAGVGSFTVMQVGAGSQM